METALYISIGSFWRECIVFRVWYHLLFANFEQRNFSPFAKILAGTWELHSTCSEKQFEEISFFRRVNTVLFFSNMIWENWDLPVSILHQRCENYTLRIQKNKLNNFCFETYVFLIILGDWAKYFWPFSKYFPTRLTKLHSTCLEKHFDREINYEKKIRFNFRRWVFNFEEFKRRCFGKYLKLHIAGPDDLFEIF